MEYVVKVDGASVLLTRGPLHDEKGNHVGEDNESVVMLAGDVVPDGRLTPHLVRQLADGHPHASSLLEAVSDKNKEERSAHYRNLAAAGMAPKAVEQPVLPTAAPGVIQVDKAVAEAGSPVAGQVDAETVPEKVAEEEVDDSVKTKGGRSKSA